MDEQELQRREELQFLDIKNMNADYNQILQVLVNLEKVKILEADTEKQLIITRIDDYENASLRVGSINGLRV